MSGWAIYRPRPSWWRRLLGLASADNARAGMEWVRDKKPFVRLKSVDIFIDGGARDVSGLCTTLPRKRGRRRYSRIVARVPDSYPRVCRHYITGEPVPIADAAEAVVFILGHEVYHIGGRHGEPAAEAQGLRWLAEYREERAS